MNKRYLSLVIVITMFTAMLTGMSIVNAASPVITLGEATINNTSVLTVVDIPFTLSNFPDSAQYWPTLLFVFQVPQYNVDINNVLVNSPAKRYDIDGYTDEDLNDFPPGLVTTPTSAFTVKKDELASNGKFEFSIFDSSGDNVAFSNASLADNSGKLFNIRIQLKTGVSDKTINVNFVSATFQDTNSNETILTAATNGKIIVGNGGVVVTPKHAVTYNANEGTGSVPTQAEVEEDQSFTVASAEGLTAPTGKQFKEWNTQSDGLGTGYQPGASITMGTEAITLYAIWENIPVVKHTITFIADSATVATREVEDGGTLTDIPVVPSKPGFTGEWDVTDFTNITGNITVTAVYTEITAPTIEITSGTVKQGEDITIEVKLYNIASIVNFDFGVSFPSSDFVYKSFEKGVNFPSLSIYDDESNNGLLGFATAEDEVITLSDGEVIAKITLTAKSGTAPGATPGNKTISFIKALYGADISIAEKVSGIIVVQPQDDPAYDNALQKVQAYETASIATLEDIADTEDLKTEALTAIEAVTDATKKTELNDRVTARETEIKEAKAELSVQAYETGALTDLTLVAAAEAKKAAADTAVAALADGTVKTALLGRIETRDGEIAAARQELEALAAINTGNQTAQQIMAHLATLNVPGVAPAKAASYKLAFAIAKQIKGDDISIGEITSAVGEVNDYDHSINKGNVNGENGVSSQDAILVKKYKVSQIQFTIIQALKADWDGDGDIDGTDVTNILLEAARNAINP